MRKSYFICGLAVFVLLVHPIRPAGASLFFEDSGLTIEPALSLSNGVLSQSGMNDIGTQSTHFDFRLGYRYSLFNFGLSYALGSGNAEQSGVKGDYKPVDTGLFVSADIPFFLKLSANYIFDAKTKIQSENNPAVFTGSGLGLGIAYSGLPYVSLMLEKIERSYKKYDGSNLNDPLKDSALAFKVGLPL